MVSLKSRQIYPRNTSKTGMGEPQRGSVSSGEQKKLLPIPGNRTTTPLLFRSLRSYYADDAVSRRHEDNIKMDSITEVRGI
jgi:hypothetical protein